MGDFGPAPTDRVGAPVAVSFAVPPSHSLLVWQGCIPAWSVDSSPIEGSFVFVDVVWTPVMAEVVAVAEQVAWLLGLLIGTDPCSADYGVATKTGCPLP